jgi:hypothetical protein
LLAGSLVEALLLDVLGGRPDIASTYMEKHDKFPDDASLGKLVEIALAEQLLEKSGAARVDRLKSYRDCIHPDRVRREQAKLDGTKMRVMFSLLELVVTDLSRDAAPGGPIEAYVKK